MTLLRRAQSGAPSGLRLGACVPHILSRKNGFSQNQKHKDALREQWKLKGPIEFAAQEARRKLYSDMTKKANIVETAVAMPALACKMCFDSKNETFYDDPYDFDETGCRWRMSNSAILEDGNTTDA